MRSLEEVLAAHPLPLFKPDGSPSELTEMQKEDVIKLATFGRVLGDLPVGYGKTALATAAALMIEPAVTVVLLPPILIDQWVKWLNSIPGAGRVVRYEGSPAARRGLVLRGARWLVMSYQIFKNDFERLRAEVDDPMTIVDECFPAGTLVRTAKGEQAIEDLQAGQRVLTSAGPKRILKVFKALAFQLTTLELSNGSIITCTPDHPIFTDLGWVRAADCQQRQVLHDSAVSDVRCGIQEEDLCSVVSAAEKDEERNYLFKILHDEEADAGQSRVISTGRPEVEGCAEDWTSSSRDTSRATQSAAQRQHFSHIAENAVEASGSKGQRYWNDADRSAAGTGVANAGVQLELRSQSGQTFARIPDELQVGLCESRPESWVRSGWNESCGGQSSGSGQEEGGQTGRVRVVRVSTAELSNGTPVFNLHVEGRHDYFAGGILVHNCQNLKNYKSDLFKKVKQFSDGLPLLLMSGTIMSKPSDGYAYVRLNNPEIYRTFQMFMNIHVAKFDFFNNPEEWHNLDLLQQNLDLSRVRRTKEEVHADLPKANYIPIEYELAPKHMALYRRLMDEQLLEVADGKIDATTAGKLYAASQQIIANWQYFSEDEDNVPNLFALIDEVLNEIGLGQPVFPGDLPRSKLIIWSNFKMTTRRILAYLNGMGASAKPKWRAVGAYGEVNSKEGVRAFMEDADALVLVAQPGSAGAGLNPQGFCWEMLFAETPTTTIPFVQCSGRIDRTGQRFNPNIRLAVARGTIQQALLRNLFANDALVQQAGGSKQSIKNLIFPP